MLHFWPISITMMLVHISYRNRIAPPVCLVFVVLWRINTTDINLDIGYEHAYNLLPRIMALIFIRFCITAISPNLRHMVFQFVSLSLRVNYRHYNLIKLRSPVCFSSQTLTYHVEITVNHQRRSYISGLMNKPIR